MSETEPKKFEDLTDAEKIKELQGQIRYAQTIIKNLQAKTNDYNGIVVQLEAKLQIALEDRAGIEAQLKEYGIKTDKK
mgnify:CR=1 FL=1